MPSPTCCVWSYCSLVEEVQLQGWQNWKLLHIKWKIESPWRGCWLFLQEHFVNSRSIWKNLIITFIIEKREDTLNYATKYLIRAMRPPSVPCPIAPSFSVLRSIRKHHIQLAFVGIITVRNSLVKTELHAFMWVLFAVNSVCGIL